jgi:hypothetical protein
VARTSDFVRICPRSRPRRHAFEGGRAVTVIVDVEDDTIRLPVQDVGQHMLALLDWSAAQVLAINLDQIERAEQGGMVMAPVAQEVEDRQASCADDDRLSVD